MHFTVTICPGKCSNSKQIPAAKRAIRPFLAVPPIWIWIFDSPPIWGVKFVEKLGFPNIFGSEKKTY